MTSKDVGDSTPDTAPDEGVMSERRTNHAAWCWLDEAASEYEDFGAGSSDPAKERVEKMNLFGAMLTLASLSFFIAWLLAILLGGRI